MFQSIVPLKALAIGSVAGWSASAIGQVVPFCEHETFLPLDQNVGQFFGSSVAIDEHRAVVGVHAADPSGFNSGAAYVFRRDGGQWGFEQKLTASDGAPVDVFGISVAVDGEVVIVGARADDRVGTDSGSAYVFVFDGTQWLQQQKIVPANASSGDNFGTAVALAGNMALISAPSDDNAGGIDAGAVYVYSFDGAEWAFRQKLQALNGQSDDRFGSSLALSGDRLLVGAHQDDDNGFNSGSAYIFTFDGRLWNQQQKLLASDGQANDIFGGAVSLHADQAIVGAFGDDDNGNASGAAYIFAHDGAHWVQQAKIKPNGAAPGDFFGDAVAIEQDTAIVGAWGTDDAGDLAGAAYVFRKVGAAWTQWQQFLPADPAAEGAFGWAVATINDTLLITAPSEAGAAHLYSDGPDCNRNGTADPCDIDLGASLDQNGNGIPDECDNSPPVCPSDITLILWPPTHQYVAIDLAREAGVSDPDGDDLAITIDSITQDEPVNGNGDGDTTCDGIGVGASIAQIRAERAAGGNGRVYAVNYTATDSHGGVCEGILLVAVPQNPTAPAIDDGQQHDSTECMDAADVNGDRTVNVDDLLMVTSQWAMTGPDPVTLVLPDADTNLDGVVDLSDLLTVIVNWQ